MVVVHSQISTGGIWLLANRAHRLLVNEHLLVQLPRHPHHSVRPPSLLGCTVRICSVPLPCSCFVARLTCLVTCALPPFVDVVVLFGLLNGANVTSLHRERLPHLVGLCLTEILPYAKNPGAMPGFFGVFRSSVATYFQPHQGADGHVRLPRPTFGAGLRWWQRWTGHP